MVEKRAAISRSPRTTRVPRVVKRDAAAGDDETAPRAPVGVPIVRRDQWRAGNERDRKRTPTDAVSHQRCSLTWAKPRRRNHGRARRGEHRQLARQGANGRGVEVIVVVMRDQRARSMAEGRALESRPRRASG
jgi:hypothetical protein